MTLRFCILYITYVIQVRYTYGPAAVLPHPPAWWSLFVLYILLAALSVFEPVLVLLAVGQGDAFE
jgi:hypothetical protein